MELILKYFPRITVRQQEQFKLLLEHLPRLNTQVNVISRKDIAHLEERHILHSLSIARQYALDPCPRILDAGTGGGFPGLPLAILHPDCQFLLCDSIAKKMAVVRELSATLGLNNVQVHLGRVEKLREKVPLVVTRAVAPLSRLNQWTRPLLYHDPEGAVNGLIALKGGDLSEELSPFQGRVEISPISMHFKEEFFSSKSIVYLKF